MDMMSVAMAKTYADSQRLGYSDVVDTLIQPEMSVKKQWEVFEYIPLVYGDTYIVVYDGEEYECKCLEHNGSNYIGDIRLYTNQTSVVEKFLVMDVSTRDIFVVNDGITHTISVYHRNKNIKPVDNDYLFKIIDLDKYGIGTVILELLAVGGGITTIADATQFWDDINTEQKLRLEMIYDTYRFKIDQYVRMTMALNDSVVQLAYSFMVVRPDGSTLSVNVAIAYNENGGAIIALKVA